MSNRTNIVVLSALVTVLLVACKKDQETKSGITGHVSAADGSGAGALVRLYEAPEPFVDQSVWSVPDGNDAVGFQYDLDFAFDHRVFSSEAADTADENGDFQFEGIVGGDYVVVAERVGECWAPYKLVTTGGGDVQVGELRIPPYVTLSGQAAIITQNTTWESGTHYVLLDNTFVRPGFTLTIEPGAIVRPSGNKALNIQGSLVCNGTPDNFVIFTAHEVINRDPDEWLQLKFFSGASTPNITYTEFRFGATGIASDVDSGLVEFCHFNRMVNEGVLALRQPPLVRRCVFERVATGVRAASTSQFRFERCVFQTCDPFAIILDSVEDGEITCNWFRDCGGSDTSAFNDIGAIKLDLVNDVEIHHNFFETSSNGMQIGSWVDSTVEIHHNLFNQLTRVLNISVTEERRGPSNPDFNYNCISSIREEVVFIHCSQHNYRDMSAANNYWGTISPALISQDYIHDHTDDQACPVVTIQPLMNSCSQIQTETGTAAGLCQ